ncbi:MAG TPA: hypothetical protein VGC42_31215 [Kofleriaceae bacterium]
MTRAALLLPSLLLAACTVGELPSNGGTGSGSGSGVDAGGGGGSDAGGNANGCVNVLSADKIPDAHMHPGSGNSDNAGKDCTASGCHLAGGGGPEFRFAGTVYQKDGKTPAQGAAVVFTADSGTAYNAAYTDKGGNFYVMKGDTASLPDPFSGHVATTTCPDIRKMGGIVTSTSCTAGGMCHGPGGTGGVMTTGLP